MGWTMAFQDYKPKTFFDQTWVGFKHFKVLFQKIHLENNEKYSWNELT